MATAGETVVIRSTGLIDSNYLVKVLKEPLTLTTSATDQYGHTSIPGDTVIERNYLEVRKRSKAGSSD